MDKRVRKQFHVVPTFDEIDQEYNEEEFKDPGPGLARQATEFVLPPFFTRDYENAMQATAQEEADTSPLGIYALRELDECNLGEKQLATFATVGQ